MYLKKAPKSIAKQVLNTSTYGLTPESGAKVYFKMSDGQILRQGAKALMTIMTDEELQRSLASGEFTHVE